MYGPPNDTDPLRRCEPSKPTASTSGWARSKDALEVGDQRIVAEFVLVLLLFLLKLVHARITDDDVSVEPPRPESSTARARETAPVELSVGRAQESAIDNDAVPLVPAMTNALLLGHFQVPFEPSVGDVEFRRSLGGIGKQAGDPQRGRTPKQRADALAFRVLAGVGGDGCGSTASGPPKRTNVAAHRADASRRSRPPPHSVSPTATPVGRPGQGGGGAQRMDVERVIDVERRRSSPVDRSLVVPRSVRRVDGAGCAASAPLRPRQVVGDHEASVVH